MKKYFFNNWAVLKTSKRKILSKESIYNDVVVLSSKRKCKKIFNELKDNKKELYLLVKIVRSK
jgi:hypothetical protein